MTSPKTLLNGWNLRPRKQLGQNFLSDPTVASKIVSHAGIFPQDAVLEIGAGLGGLTIPIARTAETVYAVETDPRLIELLKTELLVHSISNVVILKKNILSFDIKNFAAGIKRKIIVIGNLPYNISSQILIRLISCREVIERAVVTIQKDMAQRLAARPGCKAYGRITVMLRYCADIKPRATISPYSFFPKPKIDSELLEIKFKPRIHDNTVNESFFFSVIKAAFGRRRKTLKNSLTGSQLKIDRETALLALLQAGIDPQRRAETLDVAEFLALSKNLAEIMKP